MTKEFLFKLKLISCLDERRDQTFLIASFQDSDQRRRDHPNQRLNPVQAKSAISNAGSLEEIRGTK